MDGLIKHSVRGGAPQLASDWWDCSLVLRVFAENTPIDYLDFASPVSGLGSKLGIDATNKWPGESARRWGTPIAMDEKVRARIDAMWSELGLS